MTVDCAFFQHSKNVFSLNKIPRHLGGRYCCQSVLEKHIALCEPSSQRPRVRILSIPILLIVKKLKVKK